MIFFRHQHKAPKLGDEWITYDSEFNPSLQEAISYKYYFSRRKDVNNTMNNITLARDTLVFMNDELTAKCAGLKQKPSIRLKTFDGSRPAVYDIEVSSTLYLFATPIFKNTPAYLLINNIMVRYTDEIPCYKTGDKSPEMERKRFRKVHD